MSTLAIAAASLRRTLRDRVALFFIVALPIIAILVVGATIQGATDIKVAATEGRGQLAESLLNEIERTDGLTVVVRPDEQAARESLRRGEVQAAVLVPDDLGEVLRSGATVDIPVLTTAATESEQAALAAVRAAVAEHATPLQAAVFAADQAGGTPASRLELARQLRAATPSVELRAEAVNADRGILPAGFSYSAPTMLVLLVFINAVAGGSTMVENRKLGIYQRALAGPVLPRQLVLGETMFYGSMALLQSGLIVAVGAVLFGVNWGDPLAATVLVLLWALVGTGAGMLSGTLFRTPEQASAIGPPIGIAFGMLGGCMWPLELVPPALRAAGHATPHAWAVDSWTVLLAQDGGLVDIAVPLTVLAAFAVVLLAAAVHRMRRALV